MPSPFEHHRYVPKPEAAGGEKDEAPSLSSRALDLMKEGPPWQENKKAMADIAKGKGTLAEFGFLAAEAVMASTLVLAAVL